MKKFFEEPSIECIRLLSESVSSNSGLIDGSIGTETDNDSNVPQG